MYQTHQGKTDLLSSRTSYSPKRQLFLQGENAEGDSGLVLSTDAKPRLKWTPELHQHFIEAVNQLGGPDKATPKTVMRLMGIPGLTLYHLKSHLQKYRLSKNLQVQSTSAMTKIVGCTASVEQSSEVDGSLKSNTNAGTETKSVQINEAILMQIEVQRQLNEQLEVQRHLQLRIEAQGKYLQSVLEKTQETLGKQNMTSLGQDAAEQVSKTSQFADYSIESCLITCEESQKNQDGHNLSMRMMSYQKNPSVCIEETDEAMKHEMTQLAGYNCRKRDDKEEKGKSSGYEHSFFKAPLDLNTKGDTDVVPGHKALDLNGFCWS